MVADGETDEKVVLKDSVAVFALVVSWIVGTNRKCITNAGLQGRERRENQRLPKEVASVSVLHWKRVV